MHITIPISFSYLEARYAIPTHFTEFLKGFVVPDLVGRFSLDGRVNSVELISDFDYRRIPFGGNKVILNYHSIDNSLDANGVASEILRVRKMQSAVVVQCNPLFPFVSVDSLARGHVAVESGVATAAVGSLIHKEAVEDRLLAGEYDLGIFTVYSVEGFRSDPNRLSLPFNAIGLRAIELIGLRNSGDRELFNLILNSGFEL